MDNILAIDIHDDCVTGVLLKQEQRTSVVSGYGFALVEEGDVEASVSDVVRQTGYREGDVRLSIGAESIYFRNLVLPFVERKKVEKVLPFELEEQTSHRLDHFQIDFLTRAAQGETEVLAAMMDRGALAEEIARFQSLGLDPEIIGISGMQTAACLAGMTGQDTFIVLDVSFRQATLLLVDGGRIALIRSLPLNAQKSAGFTIDPEDLSLAVSAPDNIPELVRQLVRPVQQTLLAVGRSVMFSKDSTCYVNGVVGSHPEVLRLLKIELALDVQPLSIASQPQLRVKSLGNEPWNPALMNRALALALWNKKLCRVLNFRKGVFKKKASLKSVRRILLATALPLTVVCIGLIGFCWWEYSELVRRKQVLSDEITKVFTQTLPEVKRIQDPLRQMKIKVTETRELYSAGSSSNKKASKLALLTELSARIPASLPIVITRLVADSDDVRIKAETRDFNTVDNVKKELEKSELFNSVVISSANLAPKSGDVRFELKLELR